MKRFRRRFTSARRPRRRGAWYGSIVTVPLTADVPSGYYLWDADTSQVFNVQGKGVHQRTLLWMTMVLGSTDTVAAPTGQANLAWYTAQFRTDAGNDVPTAMMTSPFSPIIMEKDLMDWGMKGLADTRIVGANYSLIGRALDLTIQRDIVAKRKFDDTDALMVILEADQDVDIVLAWRTYISM